MNNRDHNGNFKMTKFDKLVFNCFTLLFILLIIDIIYFIIKN
jgi:hypothetical protein